MMNIHVVGLNYQSASLSIREQYGFGTTTSLTHRLSQDFPQLGEGLIVATCNRTEWICTNPEPLLRTLEQQNVRQYFYHYQGNQASLEHLLSVGTGLDSMILGEPQILGQLKQAVKIAESLNCFGSQFNSLMQKVFASIKELRSNSDIGKHLLSLGAISHHLMMQIFGKQSLKILCFGAGEMIEQSLPYWKNHNIHIINRTFAKAQRLAQMYQGQAFSLKQWHEQTLEEQAKFLSNYDVIVCCTGIEGFVIDRELAKKALKKRHYQTTFYLDLAVPRDINPLINELSEIIVYDIDHLAQLSEQNQEKRVLAKQQLKPLITQQVTEILNFLHQQQKTKSLGFAHLHQHVKEQQQVSDEVIKELQHFIFLHHQDADFAVLLQQWLTQHQHKVIQKTLHPFWGLLK
jgi:glutamyl-tRNA reductase